MKEQSKRLNLREESGKYQNKIAEICNGDSSRQRFRGYFGLLKWSQLSVMTLVYSLIDEKTKQTKMYF